MNHASKYKGPRCSYRHRGIAGLGLFQNAEVFDVTSPLEAKKAPRQQGLPGAMPPELLLLLLFLSTAGQEGAKTKLVAES